MAKAAEVQALTGLSADQLREWTIRRAIIAPDVVPRGSGTRALYAWQTVLVLRLAVVLRDSFGIELASRANQLRELRRRLTGIAFHALWGGSVALAAGTKVHLVRPAAGEAAQSWPDSDLLILRLDPHLYVLSRGFGLDRPEASRQLALFPAVAVS